MHLIKILPIIQNINLIISCLDGVCISLQTAGAALCVLDSDSRTALVLSGVCCPMLFLRCEVVVALDTARHLLSPIDLYLPFCQC